MRNGAFYTKNNTILDFWLISLHDVDVSNSTFGATFRLVFRFPVENIDTFTAYKTVGDRTYYDPGDFAELLPGLNTEMLNLKSGGIREVEFYNHGQDRGLLFHEHGAQADQLTYEVIYQGSFKENFDLRKFPYERNVLNVDLVFWIGRAADEDRMWQIGTSKSETPGGDRIDLPDFFVEHTSITFENGDDKGVNLRAQLCVVTQRKPWYYVISSSFSLCMILLLALTTFGTNDIDAGGAIGFIGSLVLATIAIRFVIAQDTPRVPYTTTTDRETVCTLLYLLGVSFLHTTFYDTFSQYLEIAIGSKLIIAIWGAFVVAIVIFAPIFLYLISQLTRAKT